MRKVRRFFAKLFIVIAIAGVMATVAAGVGIWYVTRDLPDYQALIDHQPATMTRVYAADGRLLSELAQERRIFVPIDTVPPRVVQAFLSAEDQNFYSHPGISVPSLIRAVFQNIAHAGQGRRPVGASTITMQVARNFLLGNEDSLTRKIREMALALRLERVLSKDRILELYLNEIFLGQNSYGIAAAALNYFNRTLDELTLPEIAYLAILPKAPSNYHPVRHHDRAIARRNWVLGRMYEDGHITEAEMREAQAAPLEMRRRGGTELVQADYFAEEVRRELIQRFGEEMVYRGGLTVRTSLEPRLQDQAERAFRAGLINYDRRHGWRGPMARIVVGPGWERRLAQHARQPGLGPWRVAAVINLAADGAEIGFVDGAQGFIPFSEMTWARRTLDGQRLGEAPRNAGQVVQPGDVIVVEPIPPPAPARAPRAQTAQVQAPVATDAAGGRAYFGLRQVPNVSGGMVSMDPQTGRVLAMVGGWSFEGSQFNRATQAQRQPGSSIKPFVYLAALENGFNPSSIIVDAPFELAGPGGQVWAPENANRNYLGPTTLRRGVELSRNLMTVRLANQIGIDAVGDFVERFGIMDAMPRVLSMSLGAGETTVLRMTMAYGELANGGSRLRTSLIDRVQDRTGRTIWRADQRDCAECVGQEWRAGLAPPALADTRARLADPIAIYQILSIMTGVTTRGTAARLAALGRPIAGKTGTSQEARDTWFVGATPDLVTGVYVGFDQPRTLGPGEEGGRVAAPIVQDYLAEVMRGAPVLQFRVPQGTRFVRVSLATGQPAQPGDRDVIAEAFRPNQEPGGGSPVDAGQPLVQTPDGQRQDTGGIY